MPGRKLTLDDLASARQMYERDGLTYQQIADQLGVAKATIRPLLVAVGVVSRPVGFQRRHPQPEPVQPPPRPVVEIGQSGQLRLCSVTTGRLRIPCRTLEERRQRRWTGPELEAIAQALRAGLAQRAVIGRLGLPERPSIRELTAARVAFYVAMQGVRRAA